MSFRPPSTFPPNDPLLNIAMRMMGLFERGLDAFSAHLSTIPAVRRPFGHAQMKIITRADFEANAGLCIDYVEITGTPTHIFCPDGRLCVLVEKLSVR